MCSEAVFRRPYRFYAGVPLTRYGGYEREARGGEQKANILLASVELYLAASTFHAASVAIGAERQANLALAEVRRLFSAYSRHKIRLYSLLKKNKKTVGRY